jgi:cobalt/nickel transport system permease protein
VHIPDGFFDAATSAAAGALAVGAVATSLRRSRAELADAAAPLAGLVAVFVFAGQMVNFPIAAGTSGHLLGAALAAILVGPATAVLAMTVVLSVQALIFADGGITALGLNVLNLAVIAPLAAYVVFRGLTRVLPRTRRWALLSGFVAGWVSVVAAALAFSAEFAIGGTTAIDATAVATAMLAVHAGIGLVEAAITALVVGSVAALRPDLVYGLRGRTEPPLLLGEPLPVEA